MQKPAIYRMPKGMKPDFIGAVSRIFKHQQRIIEKYLLCLCLAHTMFFMTFTAVSRIPVESGNV